MDSNGHYDDLRTTAIFETNHSDFATAFASLVRTFGINTTVTEQCHNSSLKKYTIEFVPAGIAAFKIKNKIISASDILDGVAAALRYSHRKIVKMEQVPSVPTQCIGVDAPDSLYVGGEAMTCLHNTGQSKYLDKFQLQVYGMHLKNMFPDLKEYEGVYLVLPEGPKKLSYKITLDDIDAAKEDIIKTAEKIATVPGSPNLRSFVSTAIIMMHAQMDGAKVVGLNKIL
jgi:hypothetical protein